MMASLPIPPLNTKTSVKSSTQDSFSFSFSQPTIQRKIWFPLFTIRKATHPSGRSLYLRIGSSSHRQISLLLMLNAIFATEPESSSEPSQLFHFTELPSGSQAAQITTVGVVRHSFTLLISSVLPFVEERFLLRLFLSSVTLPLAPNYIIRVPFMALFLELPSPRSWLGVSQRRLSSATLLLQFSS